MAVFCDFENVALGVRDANYEKFDIKPVLERLLLKGSIVVKKAYCDWDRYKTFKATMHEANFELIEIPHVRQSGKNSADIRLVVDALDLCYTKSHVDTFVIISGDSDFSPLVSKLRENNKHVIGVGVKQSTSDLLVANCDEFIFYDDLVREVKRAAAKRDERKAQPTAQPKRAPDENNKRKEELEERKAKAVEMVVEMFDALVSERGEGKIWASLLKDTLKRRRPEFNETYFGFRTFGNLLEDAQARGLLEFGRDEKSGAYVYRSERPASSSSSLSAQVEQMANAASAITYDSQEEGEELESDEDVQPPQEARQEQAPRRGRGRGGRTDFRAPAGEAVEQEEAQQVVPESEEIAEPVAAPQEPRRRGRGGRTDFRAPVSAPQEEAQPAETEPGETAVTEKPWWDEGTPAAAAPAAEAEAEAEAQAETPEWNDESPFPPPAAEKRSKPRAARKGTAKKAEEVSGNVAEAAPEAAEQDGAADQPAKAARKPAARSRRPAKPKAAAGKG